MKYIDADKLIAEIERRKNESRELAQEHKDSSLGIAAETMANEDEEILSLIATLQQEQPEVDLEKEIKRFLSNATKMNKGEWRGKYPISDIGFRAVARHFWNKGYNARKEE